MLEILLVLTPAVPALIAILWPLQGVRRALVSAAPWAALPALFLALHPGAEGTAFAFPAFFTGLHLAIDSTSKVFLVFTSILWFLAGAFARSYHASDPRKESFFGFFALTMAGNLGLVVAGDVLTAYLCFAVMTFAAYGLVVHERTSPSLRAGRIYIIMAVAGELCILTALFLLGAAAGDAPLFGSELERAWAVLDEEGLATGVGFLVAVGFGVKAGIVPLHLWLPLAHPVAPTAASALLSGAMIKAGLLSWLRFLPAEIGMPALGATLLVAGVGTAFYGVAMGVAQDDPKTVLAYSSVSQMGYMTLGVGLLLLDPSTAPAAAFAVLLYAIHHGTAKGALFLSVGVWDRVAVPARIGSASPRAEKGGAGGSKPLLVILGAALPAAVLTGAPFTSGARAKTALKDALHLVGGGWYPWLDPLLLAAATGTTVLMARFLLALHRREPKGDPAREPSHTRGLALPWVALVALSVGGHSLLPFWFPLPEGIDFPRVLVHLPEATIPVAGGVVLAWIAWMRPGWLGRAGRWRIPAGDLVVPLERTVGGFRKVPANAMAQEVERRLSRIRTAQVWAHARAAWVAERDLFLIRGPVLALLLLALSVGLALLMP